MFSWDTKKALPVWHIVLLFMCYTVDLLIYADLHKVDFFWLGMVCHSYKSWRQERKIRWEVDAATLSTEHLERCNQICTAQTVGYRVNRGGFCTLTDNTLTKQFNMLMMWFIRDLQLLSVSEFTVWTKAMEFKSLNVLLRKGNEYKTEFM